VNVSKCHWNHGPSETSPGSFVRVGSQPISDCDPRKDLPPRARARSWPPKQIPRWGTPASCASRKSACSRSSHGTESSNAANSEPSETISE
jgi:hypothetical protein